MLDNDASNAILRESGDGLQLETFAFEKERIAQLVRAVQSEDWSQKTRIRTFEHTMAYDSYFGERITKILNGKKGGLLLKEHDGRTGFYGR